MRMTLLEIVTDILSAMDSDEVNSISDNTEAMQVATAVKHAYMDIVSRANLPRHFQLFELNASLDPAKPTVMYRPEGVMEILWIKYNKQEPGDVDNSYQIVKYLTPDDFYNRVLTYQDQGQNDTVSYQIPGPNNSSIDIIGLNNKHPDFYTSFDDETILFDSYNNQVDGTLVKNRTICYGEFGTTFRMEDSFVPDLDERQFSLLYNEAKASCFADMKQTSNERAETKVRKGWVTLQHQKSAIPAKPSFFDKAPNYGRRGYYGRTSRRGFYDVQN